MNTDPHPKIGNCPLERAVAHALNAAGIRFHSDGERGADTKGLDFYLPDFDVYVEVKSGHTPRIADQMARDFNVIAVQGSKSVRFLVDLLSAAAHCNRQQLEG